MDNVRAHLYISGRVQGVFYRAACKSEAIARGLSGWVKNCPDGSVEAVLEGRRDKVDDMIKWCYKGPHGARVSDIKAEWERPNGEKDFRVAW